MHEQGVLEVLTPALSVAAATDPHLTSLCVSLRPGDALHYLHTSPEFPMKRLLAAYQADIYQIATVFRGGEVGRYHNPEFSLLEWYRVGFDHVALMAEVECLLERLCQVAGLSWQPARRLTYADAVQSVTAKPLAQLTLADIAEVFARHSRSWPASLVDDRDAALDLLIDEFVLPAFPADRATFLTDYPASQAALARVATDRSGQAVAQRFEVYWGSVELANGYHELTDASEQRQRFTSDLRKRQLMGLPSVPGDEHLMQSMQQGLPDCAGVALGIDRLMMVLAKAGHIQDVLAFEVGRA
jgi:lysyl-tRNA synthetase class 2